MLVLIACALQSSVGNFHCHFGTCQFDNCCTNQKQLEIFQHSDTELERFAGSHRSHDLNVKYSKYSVILAAIVLVFWVVFSLFGVS